MKKQEVTRVHLFFIYIVVNIKCILEEKTHLI